MLPIHSVSGRYMGGHFSLGYCHPLSKRADSIKRAISTLLPFSTTNQSRVIPVFWLGPRGNIWVGTPSVRRYTTQTERKEDPISSKFEPPNLTTKQWVSAAGATALALYFCYLYVNTQNTGDIKNETEGDGNISIGGVNGPVTITTSSSEKKSQH